MAGSAALGFSVPGFVVMVMLDPLGSWVAAARVAQGVQEVQGPWEQAACCWHTRREHCACGGGRCLEEQEKRQGRHPVLRLRGLGCDGFSVVW